MRQESASPRNPSDERRALVEATREWGYFSHSPELVEKCRGKRVLDIGMGAGPHAVPFVEYGAATYIGVDPTAGAARAPDFRSLKNPSIAVDNVFPFSVQDIERLYPNVKIYRGVLDDVAPQVRAARPNFAVMTSVTEHLAAPDSVIQSIWKVLEPDGIFWAIHHGYHSWSGHHAQPRGVNTWDRDNAEQNAVADWKHLQPGHRCYENPNLNRIRLEDLRLVVAKYFELQSWSPIVDTRALARLTPEIRRRWRKYSLAELLTRSVVIVGKRRDVPLDIDFKDRQLFHPDESYQAHRDYLHEDFAPYSLADNRVYFYQGNKVVSHSTNDFAALKIFAQMKSGDFLTVRKGGETHTFTVSQVLHPSDSAPLLELTETVPEPLRTGNYSDWTIEL